jgi:hypothetical protein
MEVIEIQQPKTNKRNYTRNRLFFFDFLEFFFQFSLLVKFKFAFDSF